MQLMSMIDIIYLHHKSKIHPLGKYLKLIKKLSQQISFMPLMFGS